MYHSIHRSVKAIAAVAAVLAFVVPAASAQPGRMRVRVSAVASTTRPIISIDTLYRQVRANAQPQHSVVVDGYFREASANRLAAQQQPVAVDDYFRTPALVPAGGSGFDWGDAGIGAASGFGLALALALAVAGLGLLAVRRRTGETKTGTAATVPS